MWDLVAGAFLLDRSKKISHLLVLWRVVAGTPH
jgi:hypothetical protein